MPGCFHTNSPMTKEDFSGNLWKPSGAKVSILEINSVKISKLTIPFKTKCRPEYYQVSFTNRLLDLPLIYVFSAVVGSDIGILMFHYSVFFLLGKRHFHPNWLKCLLLSQSG